MPKMIFVTLPVADVEKSAAFYEAVGFTKDERFSRPGSAAAMTAEKARPAPVKTMQPTASSASTFLSSCWISNIIARFTAGGFYARWGRRYVRRKAGAWPRRRGGAGA